MSDFGFDITDLNNSGSITQKIGEGFNPDGRPSLSTTASREQDKYSSQTLTSRDVTDIMAGGALTRNPAALLDASSKFVKSSLHSILAVGAQAEGFQIDNPDFQGNKGESPTLTGHDAYLKAVSGSLMGTGFAPSGTQNPLLEALSGKWPSDNAASTLVDTSGATYTHNNIAYTINETSPSLGERSVAIIDELGEDEKAIYLERGTLLKKSLNELALTIGFQFDIPNELSSYSFVQTNTYYLGDESVAQGIDTAVITAPQKKAYVSAALIECLLMLTDVTKGISLNGSFGLARAILSEDDNSDRNINPEKGLDKNNKNSISDHVFGRGFDVTQVGNFVNLGKNKLTYAAALDQFLNKLSTLPQPLHPDLIVIHPDVAKDMGIAEGFESTNTVVRTKYPSLKYVNFESGKEHTNNIHISFSPQRGGQYIGTQGWTTKNASSSSNPGTSNPEDLTGDVATAKQKAFTSYKTGGTDISLYELFLMLTDADYGIFSDEAAAIMCAISGRESRTNPNSFNGKCNEGTTSWGGDWSVGMFQFNLIAYINKANNSSDTIIMYYDGKESNPKSVLASALAYAPGGVAPSWDANAVAKKLIELQNEGKGDVDDRMWYPVNQIYMMLKKWDKNDNKKKIDQSGGFFAWGDYGDRSDCGFIFNTKFQDAVNVYITTGKTYEDLQAWVNTNLKKSNPKTVPYIANWMNGDVMYSKPVNGSLKNEELSAPINPGGASVPVVAQSTGAEPPFTGAASIKACADWLKANRVPSYATYWKPKDPDNLQDGGIGCERFARILSASLGLFGNAQTELIDKQWEISNPENISISTPGLSNSNTAQQHYEKLKNSSSFNAAGTTDGDNPPAGYLVLWKNTDGKDWGHIGVSIGNKQYVDQNIVEPRSITDTSWPGSATQYMGSCSSWNA